VSPPYKRKPLPAHMLRLFTALLILTADFAGCAAMPLRLTQPEPPRHQPQAPRGLCQTYRTAQPREKRMYYVSQ